jgi:hypothetical protein
LTDKRSWQNSSGITEASLNYSFLQTSTGGLTLRLSPELTEWHPVHSRRIELSGDGLVEIATTRPHLGGTRFWFKCRCGQRVASG